MKPKLEISLTYSAAVFSIIAIIGSIKNVAPNFNIIAFIITALICFISGTIKLYKYKKNGKIY
jgi:hypothetical protein